MFKKIKIIIILFFISIYSFSNLYSNEKLIYELKEGEKIVFIRHALAPGSGDPPSFKLNDCSTQRNLNIEGIEQSKKIGSFFTKNKIPIDEVFSSEWCRCKDTAKYAFKKYKEFPALNSTFQTPYDKNADRQIKELKNYIRDWDGNGRNLILVTHYVIITAVTDAIPRSGEIVIIDKNFNVLSTISTN